MLAAGLQSTGALAAEPAFEILPLSAAPIDNANLIRHVAYKVDRKSNGIAICVADVENPSGKIHDVSCSGPTNWSGLPNLGAASVKTIPDTTPQAAIPTRSVWIIDTNTGQVTFCQSFKCMNATSGPGG
jgi:hypothetical protein